MDSKVDDKGDVYFEVGSNIPMGRFQYKFIVDGKWTYCKQAPKVPDPYGSFNNFVEVFSIFTQVLPKKALVEYTPRQDIKLTSSLIMKDLKIVGSWDNWAG